MGLVTTEIWRVDGVVQNQDEINNLSIPTGSSSSTTGTGTVG